jgi:hypothetical protein
MGTRASVPRIRDSLKAVDAERFNVSRLIARNDVAFWTKTQHSVNSDCVPVSFGNLYGWTEWRYGRMDGTASTRRKMPPVAGGQVVDHDGDGR